MSHTRPPVTSDAEDDGPSSGSRVSSPNKTKTTQKGDYVAREVDDALVDFSVGQPGPASLPLHALAAAAAHRLGTQDAELLLQYGPRQGYRSFRRALASFLSQRYGAPVDPERLMITAGVSHGLDLAVRALSRPGDVIVVECPTYFLVTPIFTDSGLRVVSMPTDEEGLVVGALEAWLEESPHNRPRFVYTIPVHNNPRGTTLPPHRRRHLLELAALYGFWVLADEVYQLLSFPHEAPGAAAASSSQAQAQAPPSPLPLPLRCYEPAAQEGGPLPSPHTPPSSAPPGAPTPSGPRLPDPRTAPSRVLSFGSFSKMLAPALRLGWVEAGDPALLGPLRDNGVISSGGCIAQLSAGLAHSALELGLQASHLDSVVRPGLAARCAALCAALRRHLPPPPAPLSTPPAPEAGALGAAAGSSGAIAKAPAGPLEPGGSGAEGGGSGSGGGGGGGGEAEEGKAGDGWWRLVQPRGGYFVWLELPRQVDARRLLALAESRHGVRFTPGPACGGGGAHCARLSFSFYTPEELEEGARRLGAALREYLDSAAAGGAAA
ncbi:hypothetical protein HYH03_007351 [Edaphochlamys debaryana]|uniref:Aminotransferase class I/classII large domain-containing protein n=1 Tax=Edaphochlamys debaryana TaxID=47281 RepID=A0A835Y8Y3_9CHLO|nr:hypothetical protein HYH03_007351 [Edaphochlamys debaryana]|eukprot:KAG2494585.1 hypothetical protein HYH03_007351 [Edaphochlamys debaryana]